MGYQALLFCPDEKIARTVTQVLSELEFAVESCVEPFAAVKKLMAEHFDAVVVDCDNDQNASLLFKSARNSAINQASLAVAVVEGQAGVAKAFRIGANLVLTKPINVEQAKGTLRVARGLLRKGDAAKPSAPVATTPVPPKPASTVPAAPARPATLAAATAVKPRPAVPPISKPAASVPAKPLIQTTVAAAASSANPASAKAATETAGAQQAVKSGLPADSAIKPLATLNTASASSQSGSGAASAPAPAREVVAPASEAAAPGESKSTASPDKTYSEKIAVESVAAEKPADAISADTNPSASAPAESAASTSTFTFGGANLPEKSENAGSKKIFLGIAAVVFLVCAIYFGWTQLHDSVPAAAPTQTSSAPTKAPAPAQPASVRPSAASATASSPSMQTAPPQSQAANSGPSTSSAASDDSDNDGADAPSANSKPSASSTATKAAAKTATAPATKTAPAADSATPANAQPAAPETAAPAIILKNGSTKSAAKLPASDTAAPSMVGLAAGSDGNLSNLTAGDSVAKPILQTLTVSQGVSQGLLLKKVQPAYPANALRMRTEGIVKLMATVGKTGSVTTVKVVSGDALLTQSALDAVKQWKYKPYLLNGNPIEIQTEVTINFKLPH